MHPPAQSEASLRYKAVRDSTAPFWQIATVAALALWLYWPTLVHLLAQWWQDPSFSHGFLVPVFSGFIVWQQRGELARSLQAALDHIPRLLRGAVRGILGL